MARNVVSGSGRSYSILMVLSLVSALLALMYVFWSKTSVIHQLQEQHDTVNKALQKARADLKSLQDRVNELAEELASSEQEKTELETKQKDLTLRVEDGKNKLHAVEADRDNMMKEVENSVKEVNLKEMQLKTTTANMNDYKAKLDACEGQVQGLTKDLTAAKDLSLTHQKTIAEVEERKNSITKGMQDEINALKQQCQSPKQETYTTN